jgi:hypothetical protein
LTALALRRKRTRQPLPAVDRDLTGKCRVRLAPEEVQDVGGAQGGGGHQLALEGLQGRPVGEQDIAGVLTLIDQ